MTNTTVKKEIDNVAAKAKLAGLAVKEAATKVADAAKLAADKIKDAGRRASKKMGS